MRPKAASGLGRSCGPKQHGPTVAVRAPRLAWEARTAAGCLSISSQHRLCSGGDRPAASWMRQQGSTASGPSCGPPDVAWDQWAASLGLTQFAREASAFTPGRDSVPCDSTARATARFRSGSGEAPDLRPGSLTDSPLQCCSTPTCQAQRGRESRARCLPPAISGTCMSHQDLRSGADSSGNARRQPSAG
jgi:hypothetical protein